MAIMHNVDGTSYCVPDGQEVGGADNTGQVLAPEERGIDPRELMTLVPEVGKMTIEFKDCTLVCDGVIIESVDHNAELGNEFTDRGRMMARTPMMNTTIKFRTNGYPVNIETKLPKQKQKKKAKPSLHQYERRKTKVEPE